LPPETAWAAMDRVLKNLAAHSHLSIRTFSSAISFFVGCLEKH
jgi:hypothetical protein